MCLTCECHNVDILAGWPNTSMSMFVGGMYENIRMQSDIILIPELVSRIS